MKEILIKSEGSPSLLQDPKLGSAPLEFDVVQGEKVTRPHEEWYRKGYGTENVGPFLQSLMALSRPTRILEVGIGYTTPFLVEGLEKNDNILFDGNCDPNYFEKTYDPKMVIIDDYSLDMSESVAAVSQLEKTSKRVEVVRGKFQGRAKELERKYGKFDFVWFDCGGPPEYEEFMKEYWDICSEYVIFHFTYFKGQPNDNMDAILNNATGSAFRMDIVEPHKSRQGSLTMFRKVNAI